MAQQTVNIGSAPDDGTGDTLRDGGDKINDNFTELYTDKLNKSGGTMTGDLSVPDEAYDATTWNGNMEVPTKNALRDKIEDILDGVTFTGDISVPDEAYDATNWNGSLEVPTKNAVRDKIEAVVAGAGSVSDAVYGAGWDGDTTTAPSKNAVYDKIEAIVAGGGGYTPGGTDVALADGGTGASLADPNADRILFWDDSGGAVTWLTVGPGLKVVGTILVPTVIGCRAIMSADQTAADYTSPTAVPFAGTDVYDTDGFHDPASNNTRITIPDLTATYGLRAKKVSLCFTVSLALLTNDMYVLANIFKNGSIFIPGGRQTVEIGNAGPGVTINVEDVVVVGDGTEYFEGFLQVETDNSITVAANRTSFSVKVTDWG